MWKVDLPPPVHDPDDIRRLADDVLARREFQPPARSLWDRILEWFADRIGRAVDALAGDGAGQVLAWAVLLVVVGAAVVAALRLRASLVPDPGVTVGQPAFGHKGAAEWAAEAARHEAAGAWRLAVRARYRAVLARLAERGAVDDRPGRTGREVEEEVRRREPATAPVVAEATDLFELVWYGDVPAGPGEAARLRELAEVAG
jgi:hypothetical protein